MSDLDEPLDGRTARAVRTRDAIVEACLGLIDEGDLRPTGPRIAERAGVSVRSIFQHFDDLDALFSAVGEKVALRIVGLIGPIDPESPQRDRVRAFVDQRSRVMESLTPVLRAAHVYAASSAVIRQQFDTGHAFLCAQVDETFAADLALAPDRTLLREALLVANSWSTWELLRGAQGHSLADATHMVGWMVDAALAAAQPAGTQGT